MGEFSGFICDGPNCNNSVDQKDPKARNWLKVNIKTADDSYSESFTFCSYNCLEQHTHETAGSQHPAYET